MPQCDASLHSNASGDPARSISPRQNIKIGIVSQHIARGFMLRGQRAFLLT